MNVNVACYVYIIALLTEQFANKPTRHQSNHGLVNLRTPTAIFLIMERLNYILH